MKRHLSRAALAAALGLAGTANAQFGNTLFSENFDSLQLKPSVNERLQVGVPGTVLPDNAGFDAVPAAFSHVGPTGWTVDNNFDNFNTSDGISDLPNATGTPQYDVLQAAMDPPVQVELFRLAQTGIVVGNKGVSNQGDSANGTEEWEGWSFAKKDFWVTAADDQDRSQFTNASGTVAIADADEYDDLGTGLNGGYYNTGMTTASIPTNGLSTLRLAFDSSWRAESYDDNHTDLRVPLFPATDPPTTQPYAGNNQTAMIWASFDNGQRDFLPDSVWDSDAGYVSEGVDDPTPARSPSQFYKADATNEAVGYDVAVPAGATSVKFTFAYINAGNDWWWAIDNLKVSDGVAAPYWTEDFESVALNPSVNERVSNTPAHVTVASSTPFSNAVPDAFTNEAPAGWMVDNSGINPAALGDNDIGVFELEGWTFTNKEFWKFAGQSAGRVDPFTKADGIFAVADSDEYDDLAGGGTAPTRPMDTLLKTPSLIIAGLPADSLVLQFDSNWEPEDNQTAIVTVDYGNGEQQVLLWESAGANLHDTNHNETVRIRLNNPAGAQTAQVQFKYLMGGNNWFWAIDNVAIGVVPEPASLGLGTVALAGLLAARCRRTA